MAEITESQESSSFITGGLAAFIFTAVTLSDILIFPAPKNSPVPSLIDKLENPQEMLLNVSVCQHSKCRRK